MPYALALAASAGLGLCATPVLGQPQVVRPPIAQYWVDVSTHTMAGMPEMPAMPGLSGMAFPGGGGQNNYGNTRAMVPGRFVDLALYTRNKPAGSDATHAIPPAMRLGDSLPLVPVQAPPRSREPGEADDSMPRERPSGRLLIYWGCGETVRPGQPRVIDLSSSPAEFGRAMGGRFAPERGARVAPGYSLWPNERNRNPVPRDASLAGEHAITGDGVPAGLRFAIGAAHDLMPAIDLASSGKVSDSIALRWPAVATARAHYLHAFGAAGNDMILWSSAETQDTGMGLFDYLSEATIERWVREKVLLPATQTTCAVPKGIFAGTRDDGAMLRMISYGGELNLAHPPRPTDVRVPWEPQWAVRVRVKSSTMAMLGADIEASASGSAASRAAAPGTGAAGADRPGDEPKPAAGPIPGLPGVKPLDVIRGIFGR